MLRDHEAETIAAATGVPAQQVADLTLARYQDRALRIDITARTVNRQVLWGRSSGSRFCPHCLDETEGRWQLSWRLGFSFACPRHRCLLVDLCPRCERIQRRTLPTPGAVPRPAHCANRTPGTGQNGRDRRCGQLLTEATAWALPAEDDVLQAQDLINRVIAAGTADFGLYVAEPQPARAALTDLKTLAGRMLTTGSAHQLGERLPLGLHKAYQLIEALPSTSEIANPPVRLGFLGPPSAVTTAAAAVVGIAPLLHADIHEAGAVIRWLVQDRRNPGQNSPATWATWSTQASPRFYAVQLAALAPGMRPSHQVRHRLGAPRPGPSDHPEQAALRHRKVPALLWPALALRIAPLDGAGHTQFRAALSTLLLLPGNGFEYPDAERLLGRTGARGTSSRVQILHGHRCWPGILTAVVRLADHLDAHAAPIDYHRRRHLDYSDLLPNELWEEVSDQADLPTGRGVRIRMARAALYERLSGSTARQAPAHIAITTRDERAVLAQFIARLTPALALGLERAAADFLAQHGIDEPATWQPPLTLLDDLDLPGPDASSVDVVQLHTLVRTGAALGQAAEGLGTTLGAVRLILSESPAPPVHQTLTQAQARALGGTRRSARRRLPTEDLAHLLQQGWSLKAIGRKYQLNRATVGTLAREYQLAPRRGGRLPRHQVNKEWLAEQYLQRRRTLTDLAAEIGISVTHMSRITRQFGIVTRPRGAPSQQATQDVLNQAEQAPPILRLTLTGRWAWQRLDRFAEATQHATLTAAAAALGVERHTLVGQIKQLERQLQGPLFRRAHRGRPMKLTHLGHQLLAAVSEMQTGRAVAAEIGTRSLL